MLAIDGGEPVRTAPMPTRPAVESAEDADPVAALEREFAACLDLDSALVIACRDGASALHTALGLACEQHAGNEVALPALLEGRALETALALGRIVVPAEVEAETSAISARGLARAQSDETAAILVQHAFGHPATMNELRRVAARGDVPIVEDASSAFGARYRGDPAGTLGLLGVLAFGAHHLVTGGGGGGAIVTSSDAGIAAAARAALEDSPIDESAARTALAEVRRAPEDLDERRRLAWHLTYELRGSRAISGMHHARWVRHGYDRYVVRLRGILWKRPLSDTIAALEAEGVPCEVACGGSLHLDERVRARLGGAEDPRLHDDHFPVSARLPDELIAIPLTGAETVNDMNDIAEALRKVEAESIE
jgi:dTDP-4-amino-4,6-dideoxygalactose transaminase